MKDPDSPHAPLAHPIPPDTAAGQAALAWAIGQGRGDQLMREVVAEVRRNRRRRLSFVGAGCAALLAVGIFWQTRLATRTETLAASAVAVVRGPETQTLPDGTIVELNQGAHIVVGFGAKDTGIRRVVLERGEAHFQVTKNPLRPFIVVAGGVEVRAVGTAFSVQLGAGAVEVLVTEGRVAVDQPPAEQPAVTPEPLAFVNAGHRVSVDLAPATAAVPEPPVLTVSDTELRERLAWRMPLLEFSGTPLAEVVRMFNRPAGGQPGARLVLADAALGDLQVSGVLRADNTPALLRLLQNEFGLVAETRGDTVVLRGK